MSEKLSEGQKAPSFELMGSGGSLINLNDLKGNIVVLYFYPKDDTPGCTIEACEFRDMKQVFDSSNIKVFGVSADDFDSHQNFIDKFHLNFELIIDDKHEICKKYGVLYQRSDKDTSKLSIKRVTFLIDDNGVIMKIWREVDPNGHAQEIIDFIESLNKT